jgi:hypothetical protein
VNTHAATAHTQRQRHTPSNNGTHPAASTRSTQHPATAHSGTRGTHRSYLVLSQQVVQVQEVPLDLALVRVEMGLHLRPWRAAASAASGGTHLAHTATHQPDRRRHKRQAHSSAGQGTISLVLSPSDPPGLFGFAKACRRSLLELARGCWGLMLTFQGAGEIPQCTRARLYQPQQPQDVRGTPSKSSFWRPSRRSAAPVLPEIVRRSPPVPLQSRGSVPTRRTL